MHLRRAIATATVLSTAVARPHDAFSHEQVFPLGDARAKRHVHDSGSDDPQEQSTSRAARSNDSGDTGSRPDRAAFAAPHAAMHRPSSADVAVVHAAALPADAEERALFAALCSVAPLGVDYPAHQVPPPPPPTTTTRALQKRDANLYDPSTWNWKYAALRFAVYVAAVVTDVKLMYLGWHLAELGGLSVAWATLLPVFVGLGVGVLMLWVGNSAINRLEMNESNALGTVRRVAAAAGLKVRFVSAAAKDAMIARAKAAGTMRQVRV